MTEKTQEQVLVESLNRVAVRQIDQIALDNTIRRVGVSKAKGRVLSFEVPTKTNNPFKEAAKKYDAAVTYDGVVSANSRWAKEPAAGWHVENMGVGLFKINHNLQNFKYSINISLLGVPGTIQVLGSDEYCFIVSIKDSENNHKDLDFIFSLSMTSG